MMLLPAERLALGRQRRKQMRRVDHAGWGAGKRRVSAVKLMETSMRGRVPSLLALKYERMTASPFGYFRGAVPVMAYDLAQMQKTGIVRPVVRRCACSQPGRVCSAGWAVGLRHQRLR
jgi:Uncharacterized protein conserved in bacteria (DUF2252).